ncbi:MAG: Lrp/AsnC family transcriptional regulator [Candidatus Aenigmarchaeota archaeon]|nr:Lrp/AsnC family transcriptional regulator [Candidatus Aenigmarchaeota archaeon]
MEAKLDLKDRKIFYLLDENARMKTPEIAKRVGLSKNAVIYRINRLVQSGVIRRFHAVSDYQKFGVYSYDLFIKIRSRNEQRILDYFSKHPNVIWSGTLFGDWDLFAQIAARSPEDFARVLDEITVFLSRNLEDYEVKFPIKRIKFDKSVFDYEKETGYRFRQPKPDYSSIVKLDGLDKKILRCLNEKDGLTAYNEVAKAVGASLETTRNRILAMMRSGVIVKFAPYVSYNKLGLDMYLVFVNFRYLTKETKDKVYAYIRSNKEIKIGFEFLGKQQIYFLSTVRSTSELESLIKDIKLRFQDSVLSAEHMLITQELKLDFFPKALMEL